MVFGRVSESPNTGYLRYFTRVFQMVSELHKVGYQGLRVCPQNHDSSGLRIHIAPSVLLTHDARSNVMSYVHEGNHIFSWPEENHRLSLAACYTTWSDNRYFGWEDTQGDSARILANKFIERFPRISELAFMEDWSYAGWLTRIVGEMENGWIPHIPYEIEERFGLYQQWSNPLSPQTETIHFQDDDTLIDGFQFMILRPYNADAMDKELVNRLQTTTYDDQKVRVFPLPPPVSLENNQLELLIRNILRWRIEDRVG